MLSLPLPAPFRLLAVAALAIFALAAAPERAEATCGNYLIFTGQSTHAPPSSDHPAPPTKCHGPNCSTAPAPATLPIGVPEALSNEAKQLTALADTPADGVSSRRFDHPSSDGKPRFSLASIFHPPRPN